jgi:hypothetical protein
MVQAQIGAVENIAKPALEALGPGVQFMTTYKQPLGVGSSATLFAIDVKDQGAIQNTISFLSGQAPGMLEPRDFEGNTIYSANLPMGDVELALGVGFNKVFVGPTVAVENAMRLAGHPGDSAKLADEPRFRDAARLLSADAVLYSFTDVEQALRWAYWQSENADKILEQQAEKWGLSDEDKEEYLKTVREAKKDAPPLPPMDAVVSHFGDTVAELRPTPDGFRGRTLMLKPRSK